MAARSIALLSALALLVAAPSPDAKEQRNPAQQGEEAFFHGRLHKVIIMPRHWQC
jgi:hypothetical protein